MLRNCIFIGVAPLKRLINLQGFVQAGRMVAEALKINECSPDAHNLQDVLQEIAGNYDAAKKSYDQAIKLHSSHPAAQQNMRRIYESFNFGSSQESLRLGSRPWRCFAHTTSQFA